MSFIVQLAHPSQPPHSAKAGEIAAIESQSACNVLYQKKGSKHKQFNLLKSVIIQYIVFFLTLTCCSLRAEILQSVKLRILAMANLGAECRLFSLAAIESRNTGVS